MPFPVIGLGALLSSFVGGLAVRTALKTFGLWLLKGIAFTLFSQLGVLLVLALGEFLPRLLGLGQGLFSWMSAKAVSATWYAISYAMAFTGVTLPKFSQLLSGLPDGMINVLAMLRIHKFVFIIISIPIFNLIRSVVGRIYSAVQSSAGVSALISKGR